MRVRYVKERLRHGASARLRLRCWYTARPLSFFCGEVHRVFDAPSLLAVLTKGLQRAVRLSSSAHPKFVIGGRAENSPDRFVIAMSLKRTIESLRRPSKTIKQSNSQV